MEKALKKELLYKIIAKEVSEEIRRGNFSIGQKITSLRDIAKKYHCTVETALKAYIELEKEGLITSRPRSGFVVVKAFKNQSKALAKVEASLLAPRDVLRHLLEMEGKSEIVGLGTALRTPKLFPLKSIFSEVGGRKNSFHELDSHYSYPPGDEGLRSEIAKRLRLRGMSADVDNILICQGATEALFLSLMLKTKAGDEVVIHAPCFFGTLNCIETLSLNVTEFEGENLRTLETIFKMKRPKVFIIQCNFQQKTGLCVSEAFKKSLVKICSKYNVTIIEDDAYGELGHSGEFVSNLKKYDSKDIVLSCGTFSKTLGPGLRVGWIFSSSKNVNELIPLKLATTYSASAHTERAVELFLKNKSYSRHLRKINSVLAKNISTVSKILEKNLPSSVHISRPKGGFSLWLNLGEQIDSFVLYKKLMSENIAISPGFIFSRQSKYQHHIRINCGLELTSEVKRAIARVCELINQMSVN